MTSAANDPWVLASKQTTLFSHQHRQADPSEEALILPRIPSVDTPSNFVFQFSPVFPSSVPIAAITTPPWVNPGRLFPLIDSRLRKTWKRLLTLLAFQTRAAGMVEQPAAVEHHQDRAVWNWV
jgi:hypothetical protein